MTLEGIITGLSRAQGFERALDYDNRDADFSLVDGLRAPLLASLLGAQARPRALLAITATGRESESLHNSLQCFLPAARIVEFPAWETLPHERLSPSAETVGRRISALREIRAWSDKPVGQFVLVASVRAAVQPLADNLTSIEPISLAVGGRGYDLAALTRQLVDLAYSRVDMVTRRGEFALRGGILDVFAPTDEHPVRLEFFGDELEQVREFSVADQRSLPTDITTAQFPPSRELLLSTAVRQRAREMQHEFPSLKTMLAKIGEGIPVDGMESLAPALLERLVPLTHYLPTDAAIAVLSPERVSARAASLVETNREFLAAAWNAATAGAETPIDLEAGEFLTLSALRAAAGDRPWWTLSAFDSGLGGFDTPSATQPADDDSEYIRIDARSVPSFAGQPDGALGHVGELLSDGWRVAIVAQGPGLVDRARDVLAEHELAGREVDEFPSDAESGVAYLLQAFHRCRLRTARN